MAADAVYPIFQSADDSILLGGKKTTRRRDSQFSRFALSEKFTDSEVTAIHEDRRGRLWFGHWGGAHRLENGVTTGFGEKFGMTWSVMDIHEDAGGAIWFATNGGLFR